MVPLTSLYYSRICPYAMGLGHVEAVSMLLGAHVKVTKTEMELVSSHVLFLLPNWKGKT